LGKRVSKVGILDHVKACLSTLLHQLSTHSCPTGTPTRIHYCVQPPVGLVRRADLQKVRVPGGVSEDVVKWNGTCSTCSIKPLLHFFVETRDTSTQLLHFMILFITFCYVKHLIRKISRSRGRAADNDRASLIIHRPPEASGPLEQRARQPPIHIPA
jgi:hypothetical protein